MKTSTRRERQRCRPRLVPLEERFTPTVNVVSFFGITPAPGWKGSAAFGTIRLEGAIVDSHAGPIANAGLTAIYQVADLQGNIVGSGRLTLKPAAGSSNVATFAETLPPGSFSPQFLGEEVRIVATDAESSVTAQSSVMDVPHYVPQNVLFAVEDKGGGSFSGSGSAAVKETVTKAGAVTISGHGSLAAIGRNRSGSKLLAESATGRFVLNFKTSGVPALTVNGHGAVTLGNATLNVGIAFKTQAMLGLDPSHNVTLSLKGPVKVTD